MNKEIKDYVDKSIKAAIDELKQSLKDEKLNDKQLVAVSSEAALAVVDRHVIPKINKLAERLAYTSGGMAYDDVDSYRIATHARDAGGVGRIESAAAIGRRLVPGAEVMFNYND